MSRQKSLLRTLLEPLAAALVLALLVRSVIHVYSIPSASMTPALRTGDRILVTRYLGAKPRRGDVAVFRSPQDSSELIVKRIVAVPGDLVDSRLGRLRIAGYTLPEPYVRRAATTGSIEPQVVPPDSFFVLGDNREESTDSRSWGAIPASQLVGRARLILWSSSRSSTPAHADARASLAPDQPADAAGDRRLFKCIE